MGGHTRVRFRVLFRVRVRGQDFVHVQLRVRSSKKSRVRVRPSLIRASNGVLANCSPVAA